MTTTVPVRPLGDAYVSTSTVAEHHATRTRGLGAFARLPDELVLRVLGELNARDLVALARTSFALHAFADVDDLWKALALRLIFGDGDDGGSGGGGSDAARSDRFCFRRSWRATYAAVARAGARQATMADGHGARHVRGTDGSGDNGDDVDNDSEKERPGSDRDRRRRHVRNGVDRHCHRHRRRAHRTWPRAFHSDVLYHLRRCAAGAVDPSWLAFANVPRRSGLSLAEFREQYEGPNVPVIVTDVVTQWPAYRHWSSLQALAARLGNVQFRASGHSMTLAAYADYARHAGAFDDAPLYLFDARFAEKAPELAREYRVPECFGAEDLFHVLGDGARPDHRWLIAGPHRSGSVFHIDPNGTSAWNAVVRGAKKWVLVPPGMTPPGVHASADCSTVLGPESVYEWFLNFYNELRENRAAYMPFECTLRAGEVLFVPRGYWHAAMNVIDGDECGVQRAAGGGAARHDGDEQEVTAGVNGRHRGSTDDTAVGEIGDTDDDVADGNDDKASDDGNDPDSNVGDDVDNDARGCCIAVTHNYVSSANLPHVLRFLRDMPHNVSGVAREHRATLYERFRDRLRETCPDTLDAAECGQDRDGGGSGASVFTRGAVKRARRACRTATECDALQSPSTSASLKPPSSSPPPPFAFNF